MLHKQVLSFISLIRESHPFMESIYTNGSCLNFYLILRDRFKEHCPVPYYNVDHVITLIGDRYYDITGEVKFKGTEYLKLTDYYPKKGFIRAVRQMLRAYWNPSLLKVMSFKK